MIDFCKSSVSLLSKLTSSMFKSFRLFASVGIFLFFFGALLSVGATVRSPFPWGPAQYVKSKHLFKKQLAHTDRKTLNTGAIFEQEADLPTKETDLSSLSKRFPVPETGPRISLQNDRACCTLRVIFAPKVSMQILQSVLIL